MPRLNQTRVSNWLVSALALGTLGVCVPRIAEAHFHLDAPPSWANQNTNGSPQKSGPCGETDMTGTVQAVASNVVTPFQPGQTISVTITETVMHPGHYRVALATDRSMLPADPPVTAGATDCGSTVIDSTPDFPVLVDGALVHTAKFSGPQTIQVTLPTNVTCSKCTLQVIEFMSSHGLNNPGGCFYHHCADISIGAGGAATGGTGGATAGGSAGAVAKGGAGGKSSGGNGGTAQAGGPSAGAGAGGKGGTSATGGASNGGASNGGTLGAGGTTGGVVGTGGTTGASGATSGGTIGTGGNAPSTGGTTSTGGSAPTTGGVSTGGTSSSGSPNAGTGAASPPADAGCGCSIPGQASSSLAGLGALAALSALLLRRRRSH